MSLPSTTTSGSGPGRSAGELLRDRTFGLFFLGNLTSNCGTWFQNIAMSVVVFNLTGSALLVGAVNVAQFSSVLLLSPYAGAITDRVDRRRLLMTGQAVSFSGAAPLALWVALVGVDGLPGIWPLLVAALVIGTGSAFSNPAMQALVPALVPPEDLDQAVALTSVTYNIARTVGPALAAVALALANPAVAFGVNAFTFVVLFCALIVIRPREVVRTRRDDGSVRAGLRHVMGDRHLLLLLIAVAGLGFAGDPVNTLTPPLAEAFGERWRQGVHGVARKAQPGHGDQQQQQVAVTHDMAQARAHGTVITPRAYHFPRSDDDQSAEQHHECEGVDPESDRRVCQRQRDGRQRGAHRPSDVVGDRGQRDCLVEVLGRHQGWHQRLHGGVGEGAAGSDDERRDQQRPDSGQAIDADQSDPQGERCGAGERHRLPGHEQPAPIDAIGDRAGVGGQQQNR